jgi:hypothetical protein
LVDPELDFFEVLGQSVSLLWKEWPMDMQATTLPPPRGLFSLGGTCPHHGEGSSTFVIVDGANNNMPATHQEGAGMWAIMQCQGCLGFILAAANRDSYNRWSYVVHYPIGRPDASVAPEVPEAIAADFGEALKCRWLDCFRATLLMCRRAIETSCNELGAQGKSLLGKIDNLATDGKITEGLKNLAHHIRLEGNEGAHGLADELAPEKVDAVISFARQYFNYVYVLPAQLKSIQDSIK